MSASTLRAAAALIRDEWPDDPIHGAAANLFDTVLKVGPVDGGAEWDATVTLANAYLGVTDETCPACRHPWVQHKPDHCGPCAVLRVGPCHAQPPAQDGAA